jgi:hypothetical protein
VLTKFLALSSAVGLVAYLVKAGLGGLELIRFASGALLLWMPLALVTWVLLDGEVDDPVVKAALAAVSSYALTTVLYFLCALLRITPLFYLLEAVASLVACWRLVRARRQPWDWGRALDWRRPDWLLVWLIVVSLLTCLPYTRVQTVSPPGAHHILVAPDSLYYVGLVYELERHTPPLQDNLQAGSPARAYHLLPHLTTMLLARFTNQPDALRAQIVYHLTILEILMCLALYGLGATLTRSRFGGYALVALMYALAIPSRPRLTATTVTHIVPPVFYFSFLPHLSSLLDPVAISSWQMYSGVVVAYGLILAVCVASIRVYEGITPVRLLLLAGLIVGALARFRIQAFLAALPVFLVLMLIGWMVKRAPAFLTAAGVAVLLSVVLLLEMRSSIYLPGTSTLRLGYNDLTSIRQPIIAPVITSWPFSGWIYHHLRLWLHGGAFRWTWQVVCMVAFVLFSAVGIPLLAASAFFFSRRMAKTRYALFAAFVVGMCLASLLVGITVTQDYDPFSVAGQALFHIGWYLFPLASVAVVGIARGLRRTLRLPPKAWIASAIVVVLLGAGIRGFGQQSLLVARVERDSQVLSQDRWLTMRWLHDHTPKNAIVISNEYIDYNLMFSALAGRAAYVEAPLQPAEMRAEALYHENRLDLLADVWTTTQSSHLCALLADTPATRLVEFADQSLAVHAPPCLVRDWVSPHGEATIWTITV